MRPVPLSRIVVLLQIVTAAWGCTLGGRPTVDAPAPAAQVVGDEDEIPWAKDERLFVVVRQSCRSLDVYEHGRRIRTYDAVFGLGGMRKRFQGDRRTPVGLYAVVGKRRHPRWQHFLLLDYPTPSERLAHEAAVRRGEIPREGNGWVGPGSEIGIHGTDKPNLNRRGVDWTFGCVSVSQRAAYDLSRLLPVGTLVLITE